MIFSTHYLIFFSFPDNFNTFSIAFQWAKIDGKLKWVASGHGIIVGVNAADLIYYRVGITPKKPLGTKWVNVPGKLARIDIHRDAVFGVNAQHQIYKAPVAPIGKGGAGGGPGGESGFVEGMNGQKKTGLGFKFMTG